MERLWKVRRHGPTKPKVAGSPPSRTIWVGASENRLGYGEAMGTVCGVGCRLLLVAYSPKG